MEHCCMGASTPRVVHSTAVVEEYIAEMAGLSTGNGTKAQKTMERV